MMGSLALTDPPALRRDVAVFLPEQPEPRIDVAAGHLEQAGGAAGARVDDAIALRQGEDVAPLPADGITADLALARALDDAAHRIGGGAEGDRGRAGIELHQ